MPALNWVYLRLACTCEETCQCVWPPNASLYASSTCRYLRLLAIPFGQGFTIARLSFKHQTYITVWGYLLRLVCYLILRSFPLAVLERKQEAVETKVSRKRGKGTTRGERKEIASLFLTPIKNERRKKTSGTKIASRRLIFSFSSV